MGPASLWGATQYQEGVANVLYTLKAVYMYRYRPNVNVYYFSVSISIAKINANTHNFKLRIHLTEVMNCPLISTAINKTEPCQ